MKKPGLTKEWLTSFSANVTGVIIGIVLTFGITLLVQHRQERKQAERMLSMVATELETNIELLELQKAYLISEGADARALYPYVNRPESIPSDTLQKHIGVLTGLHVYDPLVSSFEVLKNSSQIQNFPNKELIIDIFTLYRDLEDFYSSLDFLITSHKEDGISIYLQSGYLISYDLAKTDDLRAMFDYMTSENSVMRNYLQIMVSGQDRAMIERSAETVTQIESVIEKINKEIE